MIAIDTLVHNFLHRTGILRRFNAEPPVWCGLLPAQRLCRHHPSRRRADRCPAVQSNVSADLSRFVQHAIWQYCARDGLDVTAIGSTITGGASARSADCD